MTDKNVVLTLVPPENNERASRFACDLNVLAHSSRLLTLVKHYVRQRTEPSEGKVSNDSQHPQRRARQISVAGRYKERAMNWDRVEGNWKQLKGNAKQQWGKLTDDQLDVIAGKRDQLAGKIQESYGVSMDVAQQQISEWQKLLK
jgi:uncharacterized protein YjbJ (UPF0337 family)